VNYFDAIILGVVEGITEFIPVSSTGHLIITSYFLGLSGEKISSFEVFIQLGAILAVIFLFKERLLNIFNFEKSPGSNFRGFEAIKKIAVACLPCFVLGALCHGYIKRNLFSINYVIAALVVGAILMLIAEKHTSQNKVETNDLEQITTRQALIIGLFQCLALWPGMSRSASTIVGGLFQKIDRRLAAEFSFIVAVPVMFAATAKDLIETLPILTIGDVPFFATGFIVSFIVALLSIKWFIGFLGKYTLKPFAVYRVLVAFILYFYFFQ